MTDDRLIPRAEVERIAGIGRSTIYKYMAKDMFPKPAKLARGCVRWRESAVRAWMDSLRSEAAT